MKTGAKLIFVLLLVAAGVAAWLGSAHLWQSGGQGGLTGEGERTLPAFAFPDLDERQRQSGEWAGKILVINFWATWCPPCREEMPLLVDIQKAYEQKGVQVIGIAIDDPGMVRDFADVYGINFPVLIGSTDAIKLANRLGNRFDSLPFTAIFDGAGETVYVQAGRLTRQRLEAVLEDLF